MPEESTNTKQTNNTEKNIQNERNKEELIEDWLGEHRHELERHQHNPPYGPGQDNRKKKNIQHTGMPPTLTTLQYQNHSVTIEPKALGIYSDIKTFKLLERKLAEIVLGL